MVFWRRLIPGLTGLLLYGGIVRADLMPEYKPDAER